MLSKLGMYESSHLLHTWIYDLYTPGGDASEGGSDKVSKPPTRWVLNGHLDGIFYCQVTWNFMPPKPHGVTLFELVDIQHEVKHESNKIERFCYFQIRFTFDLGVPPLASQQTAAWFRDRRSSMPCGKASQIFSFSVLGAVMSVVRRGTSLTCMVQGSFFNGTLFWGDQTWCEMLLVILRDLPWRWNSALVFGWCHVMTPVLRVVCDQCLRRFCLVVITTSEEEIQ